MAVRYYLRTLPLHNPYVTWLLKTHCTHSNSDRLFSTLYNFAWNQAEISFWIPEKNPPFALSCHSLSRDTKAKNVLKTLLWFTLKNAFCVRSKTYKSYPMLLTQFFSKPWQMHTCFCMAYIIWETETSLVYHAWLWWKGNCCSKK